MLIIYFLFYVNKLYIWVTYYWCVYNILETFVYSMRFTWDNTIDIIHYIPIFRSDYDSATLVHMYRSSISSSEIS